jgi:hypothetical protein
MGGIGAPWLATVTTAGAQVVVVVVRVTLRTRFTLRTGLWYAILRALCDFFLYCFTTGAGESTTCAPPAPISAPPHVHAHNFAKAMRTDIISDLLLVPQANAPNPPRLRYSAC